MLRSLTNESSGSEMDTPKYNECSQHNLDTPNLR